MTIDQYVSTTAYTLRVSSSVGIEFANAGHAVWNAAISSMMESAIFDAAEYEPRSSGEPRYFTWNRSATFSAQSASPAGISGTEKCSMRLSSVAVKQPEAHHVAARDHHQHVGDVGAREVADHQAGRLVVGVHNQQDGHDHCDRDVDERVDDERRRPALDAVDARDDVEVHRHPETGQANDGERLSAEHTCERIEEYQPEDDRQRGEHERRGEGGLDGLPARLIPSAVEREPEHRIGQTKPEQDGCQRDGRHDQLDIAELDPRHVPEVHGKQHDAHGPGDEASQAVDERLARKLLQSGRSVHTVVVLRDPSRR